MSIEQNAMAASPKAVAGAASHGGKDKIKSGDAADASVGVGFAALLTSLESQPDQAPSGGAEATTGEAMPQVMVLPGDLALLLAQAGAAGDDPLGGVGDAGLPGAKGGVCLRAPAAGVDRLDMSAAASPSLVSDKPADSKQSSNVFLGQMVQSVSTQAHKARGSELQADAAAKLADLRALKPSSFVDLVAREPALSGALLTSGSGDGLLRSVDRVAAKASVFSAGSGLEGVWGQQSLPAGNRVDASPVMADPATMSLESMVADTVSYWVAQGVQNAELKLDGFGDQAVEVSISLKGGDAHIDFRTDQPEIRQVLEGAVAHLTDILASEGLVLSGVSVGASGQDGRGAQEQRNRPGVRQVTLLAVEGAPTEGRQRAPSSIGRALDLFV